MRLSLAPVLVFIVAVIGLVDPTLAQVSIANRPFGIDRDIIHPHIDVFLT